MSLVVGFKPEVLDVFASHQLAIDIQDEPYIFTRFGYLRANFFLSVKTEKSDAIDIEGASVDNSNYALCPKSSSFRTSLVAIASKLEV